MKAVIFGATGLVGNEVLNACIATDKIIKVYVVTRRALGDDREKNPKVDVILHSDFAQYPLELLDRLKGIELCLWYASQRRGDHRRISLHMSTAVLTSDPVSHPRAIGGVLSKFNNDKKLAYAANVVYPCAAASAFAQHLGNDSPSGRIRFVFCSGKFAEPDPAKLLWFLGDSRRWKGETETFLQTLAKQQPGRFEAFSVRPGLVIPNNPPPAIRLATVVSPGITAQQTGTVMVRIGLDGWKQAVLEQDEMLAIH
ncbi:NAD(P)-binding domain protein [Beauveria brongniartii RCEF 3172]|uniref:NAD(P)-binding domain protein n=1 Tax=Beauveria brongniartii RCEF 3172 TaxID=1081107 RepID=A0A167KXV2_9HYPO|nr:NAD(P)-binding domain protein [Beauveria brongniartii RCEF 3172]